MTSSSASSLAEPRVLLIRQFATEAASVEQLVEIHALLLEAFEGDFDDADWEHALGGTHVVALDGSVLVAHASVVARVLEVDGVPFRTGYVEAVAVSPSRHGEGIGSLVMHDVAEIVTSEFELGGLGTGRHSFYERVAWERWQGPTFVRRGSELMRTEEDDDGVMVLRFGPSSTVDLTAAISCEARPGDDW